MDLTKYSVSELIEYATKYLENKEKLRKYINKYRKTPKGKLAVRKSSLKYYNKHRKVKKKIETNNN
jgi:hypothetical protein